MSGDHHYTHIDNTFPVSRGLLHQHWKNAPSILSPLCSSLWRLLALCRGVRSIWSWTCPPPPGHLCHVMDRGEARAPVFTGGGFVTRSPTGLSAGLVGFTAWQVRGRTSRCVSSFFCLCLSLSLALSLSLFVSLSLSPSLFVSIHRSHCRFHCHIFLLQSGAALGAFKKFKVPHPELFGPGPGKKTSWLVNLFCRQFGF